MARPTYVLEAAFGSNPDDDLSLQTWTDITRYLDVKAGVRVTRGRTEEQGDVQPSRLTLTLDNRDGRFTPNRPGSPYYPNVQVGKRIRFGLGWPGAGKQLVEGDPSFESGTNGALASGFFGGPTPVIGVSALHPAAGTQGIVITWGTGGQGMAQWTVRGLVIGQTYTASFRAFVPVGSPDVSLGIAGVTFGSTVATKGALFDLATTFVATANTQLVQVIGQSPGATVGTQCFLDAMQVELGSARTTFTSTAGLFTWRFTGDVDEWPLAWDGGPALYAETQLTATDRFKRLGELGEYRSTLEEDILDDSPIALYPLGEPTGSFTAGDVSGNSQPPLIGQQVGTGGAIVLGQRSTDTITTVPDFYKDRSTATGFFPVDAANGRFLTSVLRSASGGPTATGATIEAYVVESTSPLTTGAVASLAAPDGSWFGVDKVTGTGNITARFYNAKTGVLSEVTSGVGMTSDRPQQLSAVLDIPSAGQGRITFRINSIQFGTAVTFTMAAVPSWNRINVGGRAKATFRGVVSFASFYNYPVTSNTLAQHWTAAFNGKVGAGDLTYYRMAMMCGYSGLGTLLFYNGGGGFSPQSVGPQEIGGSPLDAMRLVEQTEGGMFFLTGDGAPVLHLRGARYNATPSFTVAADRLDPDAITFRGDDYGLVNDVTGQRPDGAVARVVSETSRAAKGRRKASFTAIPATDDELRALAAWQANTGGIDRNRITGVRISLLNQSTVVSSVLAMQHNRKVSITSLPGQAPSAALEVFAEGWTETIGETEWTHDYVTSPGDVSDVWQIGVAGHSEIGTTTKIGY